ncbi:MAG TPA: hypothetical protein RMH99_16450 [Sandaracinaceae bacterium LLY-WYZ-13_1]|nr:hypothetical protein [Sandaracinaceae bacterium LLY-WYZ-13_1]
MAYRIVVGATLAGAVATSLWVASIPPGRVFFSIDGGIKYLMTDQLARGIVARDLHPPHEDELGALWRDGMFPAPPFANQVYRVGDEFVPGYPWTFPALSAPFYALFDSAGLLVLPVGSLWVLWALIAWIGWRRGWGPGATVVALATTSVASPLILYAGTFWEHTLGVCLCFAGFAEVALPPSGGRRRPALLGACLGGAFWVRPEAGAFAVAVLAPFVALRWRQWRRWLPFAVAAGVVAIGYLGLNELLYDRWFGLHGQQSLRLSWEERLSRAVDNGGAMWEVTTGWSPFVWGYVPVAAAALSSPRMHRRPGVFEATLTLPLFLAVAFFVVPNTGGHTLGSRYLLPLYPVLGFLFGAFVHAAAARGGRPARALLVPPLVAALAWSTHDLFDARADALVRVYERDNVPCHQAIAEAPAGDVLAFNQPWYAAHLSGSHDGRYVLATPDLPRLHRAVSFAAERGRGLLLVTSAAERHAFRGRLPEGTDLVGRCTVADVRRMSPRVVRRAARSP